MKCLRCQQDNPSHAKYCLECGAPFKGSHESGRPAASHADLQRVLSEALEQQTATGEILKVISESPVDVRPVFDTIVQNARRLCGADSAAVLTYDGELIQIESLDNPQPEHAAGLRQAYPMPANRGHATGRAILTGYPVHVPDVREDSEYAVDVLRDVGLRSVLSVPMIRDGIPIGAITVQRWVTPRPFSDKQIELVTTFADQAVIAIENVRLFTELQGRNRALTEAHSQIAEALDRQTATSEILRVISSSQTDVQPVFETIVINAVNLCGARMGAVYRFDGVLVHLVAHHNYPPPVLEVLQKMHPRSPQPDQASGRAILTRAVAQIEDMFADSQYPREVALAGGWRSILSVPMLRDGVPIGAIVITRSEAGRFSDGNIELLQTFADQAVIAIENVRLFTELQDKNRALTEAHAQVTEALEQQTATAEILRVISTSPTDLQPVLDAVVRSAARFCGADDAELYRLDEGRLKVVAHHGPIPAPMGRLVPVVRGTVSGRAVLERRAVHVADLHAEAEGFPVGNALAREFGFRTGLAVPLLREGTALGTINLRRTVVNPFSDKQVALLETFANQAVIAIENVRLFKELEARNHDLTRALDTQTATSDILRVISRSPTDVQPVFDAVAESAARLCDAFDVTIFRLDGGRLRLVAHHGPMPVGTMGDFFLAVTRETVGGRSVIDAVTLNLEDVQADADEFPEGVGHARRFGHRAMLSVPLTRDGAAIGVIQLRRAEPGRFTDRQVALLQTFADQAVIAIENVRLFTELQVSNRELTTALDTQTATSDILRVISRSQTDVQPVFDAILASAVRLLRGYSGLVTRIAGHQIEVAALTSTDDAGDAATRAVFPQSHQSDGPHAQAMRDQAPINIADAQTDPRVPEAWRTTARARGYRSWVIVPLLRHDEAVGTIAVARREPGGFTDDEIALLQTFADQAVIAIENARLLTELQARTQELTRSVGELRALGEVGQAISSTLDLQTVLSTIVARATQLSGTDAGVIYEYDEEREVFVPRATERLEAEIVETMLATPVRKGEGATGRLAEVQEPIQVPDILAAPAESRVRGALVRAGYRALLAVPLVHDDRLLGGLTVIRKATGTFAPEVIELLRTFATQSALAIQNARLFLEIEDKSRQLEAASQHKSEFLANMSHELRTPLNAIIGFSEVLGERMFGELNEKQEEYLKDIHASGQHLLSLINDILDLSKIEAGRMELELADFHLPQAIENALVLVRERALRRGITLEQSIDPRLGAIPGDERKIKQVLLNLLSNAIKFTPEGGRVGVRAAPVDEHVEVAVSDTGVGIAPEDHEVVFEEFRQVGAAEKRAEGTGLGLALARRFIELHGGRIWVKSQVGAGSTFTFTLPVPHGE